MTKDIIFIIGYALEAINNTYDKLLNYYILNKLQRIDSILILCVWVVVQ